MGRRSKEEWDQLIEEQKTSGKSVRKFCIERGIPISSFRWCKEGKSTTKRCKEETPYVSVTVPVKEEPLAPHEATLTLPGGVVFQMRW